MTLDQTLVLYLVIGVAVAAAVFLSAPTRGPGDQWFQSITATLFWPLYLPLLLSRKGRASTANEPGEEPAKNDELTAAIAQVDLELESALRSLDGWAEDVLARERGRLEELRLAWTAQAERIRQMDRLLGRPEHQVSGSALLIRDSHAELAASEPGTHIADRIHNSEKARRHNLERLRQVRQRTHQDLMATLAWVRELASMIHLAKFTGAPASRAEELVAQIAAAVEGLSALTWQDECPLLDR